MSIDGSAADGTAGDVTYVQKACAYITRGEHELLAFEGPGYDGFQIPKGTIEAGETPREAVFREVAEESGLGALADTRHLATDVWRRRPARRYVRHFFHATVHDPRDRWTHTVTGEGEEVGAEFEFEWVELPPDEEFALALDDYVHLLG
jgi:8-oxo-dGTP pyrophosphatase MutT (NUDIX family)